MPVGGRATVPGLSGPPTLKPGGAPDGEGSPTLLAVLCALCDGGLRAKLPVDEPEGRRGIGRAVFPAGYGAAGSLPPAVDMKIKWK